jgi:nucleotide-binding universal stress UspA family protein
MTSTIVVGYIPTPQGDAALQRAIQEARVHDAELVVVNSTKRDAYIDENFVGEDHWSTLDTRVAEAGVKHRMVQPEEGYDAADLILEACRRNEADLVVIGLRKRSAVGKLLLGSTAQRVLMQAECDILAVRATA